MKDFIYSAYLCLALSFALPLFGHSQYCTPVVDVQFSGGMGITNFDAGNVARNSLATEGYVMTGDTLFVNPGSQLAIAVTCTVGTFCSQNDVRVYMDFNGDQDFYDAGEDIFIENAKTDGTYSQNVTIPATAALGTFRMRVMNKMIVSCGHEPIEPCGQDSFAYHGEIEDYYLNVSVLSNVTQPTASNLGFAIGKTNDGGLLLKYNQLTNDAASLSLLNLSGKEVFSTEDLIATVGKHEVTLDPALIGDLSPGILIARFTSGNQQTTRKLIW